MFKCISIKYMYIPEETSDFIRLGSYITLHLRLKLEN